MTLTGKVKDGTVIPDEPFNLPDNTIVEILVPASNEAEGEFCADGIRWPQTAEEIEKHIERMDSRLPVLDAEGADRLQDFLAAERELQKEMVRASWATET